MTDQHTPGPWEMYRTSGEDGHRWGVSSPTKGCISCAVAREEDARLIAAAPLMLEALRAFLEVNGRFNDMLHDKLSDADIVAELDGKLDIAAAQAEAAIAAAEGGTDAG